MIVIDANILLYAYHPASKSHDKCRSWLEDTLDGHEIVGLAWITIFAFLRIVTSPRVFDDPLTMSEAEAVVSTWIAHPTVVVLEPSDRYWGILQRLLHDGQTSGGLVMDAALAALAIENGATVCTSDRDFHRFDGLRLLDPTR